MHKVSTNSDFGSRFTYYYSPILALRKLWNRMFRNTLLSTADTVLLFDAGKGEVSMALSLMCFFFRFDI